MCSTVHRFNMPYMASCLWSAARLTGNMDSWHAGCYTSRFKVFCWETPPCCTAVYLHVHGFGGVQKWLHDQLISVNLVVRLAQISMECQGWHVKVLADTSLHLRTSIDEATSMQPGQHTRSWWLWRLGRRRCEDLATFLGSDRLRKPLSIILRRYTRLHACRTARFHHLSLDLLNTLRHAVANPALPRPLMHSGV